MSANSKWKPFALLVASMMIASLVGCGNNSDATSTPSASSSAPAKEVKLTFWHNYSTASPEEKTLTETLIPKFEADHPGIKVKAVAFPWDELHKKIQIGGNAGELPDVSRLDIIWVPEFQKSDLLVPLDEQFQDFNDVSKQYLTGPLSTAKVGDHYYGLPLNTNTKVLFWNKDLFEKSGLSAAPATTDEFFANLDKLKASNAKGWGFGEPALQGWNMLPWLWSNGADVLSPNFDTAQGYINSSASIDIITKYRDAFKKGLWSGFKQGDIPVTEGHANGTYAMMAEGPWAFAQFQSQFPNFKAMSAQFPAGSTGSVQVLGGEDIGVFKGDHQQEAWEFAKFMTSEEVQVEMGKVGQIPVNLKALDNADIKKIEYFAPFLEQLKTAKARPPIPQWPQIDTILSDTMNAIFLTDRDVKTQLDAAADKIDALLKQ
ncbi:extracellular solute-binding protein [Cohnella faecalis]|uniref:Extracellular solute-binding protein n=1 Tax=Cohnella faecalis TaxID=2315694 RepID=A0A398CFX9_9BACL|nr:extracellular solute-binding protein [Cohnella faecalis]RIE01623.1 extracellular solute-binding protein [Cohnella faecalis]